jgi:hypothetical protein
VSKNPEPKIVLELTEEQAEWIRIGLLCYRDTCQVPASFGSAVFLEKVQQISDALAWFDVSIDVQAKKKERKK